MSEISQSEIFQPETGTQDSWTGHDDFVPIFWELMKEQEAHSGPFASQDPLDTSVPLPEP